MLNQMTKLRSVVTASALIVGLSACGTFGIGGGSDDDVAAPQVAKPVYAPTDLPPGAVALSASVSSQLTAAATGTNQPITISDGNVIYRLGPSYLSALGQRCRPFVSRLNVGGAQARSAVCSDGTGWYAVRPVALSVE